MCGRATAPSGRGGCAHDGSASPSARGGPRALRPSLRTGRRTGLRSRSPRGLRPRMWPGRWEMTE
eukprot:12915407-Alexandrium_andersonii.AAC.1